MTSRYLTSGKEINTFYYICNYGIFIESSFIGQAPDWVGAALLLLPRYFAQALIPSEGHGSVLIILVNQLYYSGNLLCL